MKKDLFEQFAENSEDIRVPVSAHSWDKLQARLDQEKKEPKYRTLLRQISVAAAISLIAVNVFVLLFFVSKLNNSAEPNGMVLMEIPEGQDATPRIVPASYFDKVEIQEGSRNNRLINQDPSVNKNLKGKQPDFSDTHGIWTDDKQRIELSIFKADEGGITFSISDKNDRLMISAFSRNSGLGIANKKGQFKGLLVQQIQNDPKGLKLVDTNGALLIERTDEHSITLIHSTDEGITKYLLNKVI